MPRPNAIQAAEIFRQRLRSQEAAAAQRMATIYADIHRGLLSDIEVLAERLAAMETISPSQFYQMRRTQALLKQVEAL